MQDGAIEQGAEGLILGRGRNQALHGELAEESFNLWDAHFLGMTFVMKQNVTANPLNVGIFCTIGVIFEPNLVFNLF
jgi:hypothetical protein